VKSGFTTGFVSIATGNIWTSAGDCVHCLAADGTLLGKIKLPETVANISFGGPNFNRFYICATRTLYEGALLQICNEAGILK
jgi:gluconolactonase